MKRNKLIVVAVVSACLLAVLLGVFNLCRYYFPMPGPTSDLFERYKDNPHIRATYLRNFQVNDTLRVDVTLLQASTDSAWVALMVDFGAPEEFIDMYNSDRDFFERDKVNSLTIFYIDKKCIHKRKSKYDPDSWLVIGSFTAKTFCVFMTDDIYFKNQIGLTEFNKLEK